MNKTKKGSIKHLVIFELSEKQKKIKEKIRANKKANKKWVIHNFRVAGKFAKKKNKDKNLS